MLMKMTEITIYLLGTLHNTKDPNVKTQNLGLDHEFFHWHD